VIKKNLAKHYLEMFAEIAEKIVDFKKFYKQSGKLQAWGRTDQFEGVHRLHEGVSESHLLRHWREHRRCVFSSFLGNLEAHYMVDPVDEYTVHQLKEFNGNS